MAGTLVHEINNPLAIIGLNASSIAEAVKEEEVNRGDIQRFLQKINDTVMRINDITMSLRKLSGKSDGVIMRPQDIQSVINDAMTFCFERFNANGVQLETDIENFIIECKSVEISQVLIYILNNAYYAVRNVSKKHIKITSFLDGDYGVVEICDTGPGVPANVRSKIMEPFFSNKPVNEGTGLGLSICKKIIENHQGSFYLSEKKNTTFVVRLPLLSAAQGLTQTTSHERPFLFLNEFFRCMKNCL